MDGWMRAETVTMKADGEINGWMDGGCGEREKKGNLLRLRIATGLMVIDVRLYKTQIN
jgi:hypothetical protein